MTTETLRRPGVIASLVWLVASVAVAIALITIGGASVQATEAGQPPGEVTRESLDRGQVSIVLSYLLLPTVAVAFAWMTKPWLVDGAAAVQAAWSFITGLSFGGLFFYTIPLMIVAAVLVHRDARKGPVAADAGDA